MRKWFFKDYDPKAFGLFRFFFYFIILSFYSQWGLHYDQWLTLDFKPFFDPVSLFTFFDFQNLESLKKIDLLFFWKLSLIFSAIGLFFPISSLISFVGIFILAGIPLNFGKIHHSNHLPVVIMGILAFSFSAGHFSVDSWLWKKWRWGIKLTDWSLQTAKMYMCLVYFFSGYQKMFNSGLEWVFSDNMQNIIITRPTVTPLGLYVSQFSWLCQLIALVTVIVQLSAPIAFFKKGWVRFVIVGTLFMLHIGTYIILGNHGFFFQYNICFLVWLPWEIIYTYLEKRIQPFMMNLRRHLAD